MRGIRTIA